MKQNKNPRQSTPKSEEYSYDPALKLVTLHLLEESQKNSRVSADLLKYLKGYLEYCRDHESNMGIKITK